MFLSIKLMITLCVLTIFCIFTLYGCSIFENYEPYEPVGEVYEPPPPMIYVSPDGEPENPGTKDEPIDLITAFTNEDKVKPGYIVWIAGGEYEGPFEAMLSGTPEDPIIYKAMPGHRARLTLLDYKLESPDPSLLSSFIIKIRAAYVWLWGLEISAPDNIPPYKEGGQAVWIEDSVHPTYKNNGCKLINLVIHDNIRRQGITAFRNGDDQEIYGCIIYRNGKCVDPPGVHGIYTQNSSEGEYVYTTKTFAECLIFDNFHGGLCCYSQDNDNDLGNFLIEGVASWCNGLPGINATQNFLVYHKTGETNNIHIHECYSYYPESRGHRVELGDPSRALPSEGGYVNHNLTVEDSVFASGYEVVLMTQWDSVTFQRNILYHNYDNPYIPLWVNQLVNPPSESTIDYNTYYSEPADRPYFRYSDAEPPKDNYEDYTTIEEWREATGWDSNSSLTIGKPSEPMIYLRPNKYEPYRAHLIIYNWPKTSSVSIDLGGLWEEIKDGDRYSIVNVENIWDFTPVAEGTYHEGESISIPMTGNYAPEFACYLVTKKKQITEIDW